MADKVGNQDRNYFHLVLLAKNLTGYHNLIKLVSRASLEGYYYKPRIDRALLAEHAEGLIALSGCYSGEPSRAILDGDFDRAREAAGWYRDLFGEDYFLELQDHGNPDDQTVNAGLIELQQSSWASRWWSPTTPTTRRPIRPPPRTSCCASRPTATSKTRSGCACSRRRSI